MAGIQFVFTNAMKDALRSRGFTDTEIEQITPAEAQKILLTPDPRGARMHPGDRNAGKGGARRKYDAGLTTTLAAASYVENHRGEPLHARQHRAHDQRCDCRL